MMSLRGLKRRKKKKKEQSDPDALARLFATANNNKITGKLDQAEKGYRQLIRMAPDHLEGHNNLANILYDRGLLQEALIYYRGAVALAPENYRILYNYGTCLFEDGELAEAASVLRKVINLVPSHAEAHASLGVVCQGLGDLDGAFASLSEAVRLKPDYLEGHRFLGLVRKDQGDLTGALKQFSRALQCQPEDAMTWYLVSRYKKYKAVDDRDIARITTILTRPDLAPDAEVFLNFALGKIYDDLALAAEAFHHYQAGNTRKKAMLVAGPMSSGIDLGRITRVFRPELFSRLAGAGLDSELPVFIVGMPRSGTTLVEQICASHSAVWGRGELKDVSELKNSLLTLAGEDTGYPECLTSLDPSLLKSLGEPYLARLGAGLPSTISRVVDKMPTNFIELGLIRIFFPGARIIHCRRDPIDTCLSNYFQNFEEGNEFSFDLETLAFYYRKYEKLMAFWQDVLPGTIHEVCYEDLVADFAVKSRELIEFLGLEWQEECLSFHQTRRMVHTASDWQVRQPVYRSSVQRWKRYEPFLQPLIDGLADTSPLV